MPSPGESGSPRPYHHGNLRQDLLDEARAAIRESGPVAWSLRELARRAGVSHAAPAHHFGDKAGLLTALATEGFHLLADALDRARETAGFLEVGLAYIRFAVENPDYFEVMYLPALYRADDPALGEARQRAAQALYGSAGATFPDGDRTQVGLAGWCFAHGFATLWLAGNLQPRLGADDPIAAATEVAQVLFAASRRQQTTT